MPWRGIANVYFEPNSKLEVVRSNRYFNFSRSVLCFFFQVTESQYRFNNKKTHLHVGIFFTVSKTESLAYCQVLFLIALGRKGEKRVGGWEGKTTLHFENEQSPEESRFLLHQSGNPAARLLMCLDSIWSWMALLLILVSNQRKT